MTPAAALAELHAAGVRVRLDAAGVVVLDAATRPPPAVLALARAHRDGIAALLWGEAEYSPPEPPKLPNLAQASRACARVAPKILPGVPLNWCEGVALLAGLPPPAAITPDRWAALAAMSQRLLHEHGAALHGAGWGTLDLWGLHRTAPDANPAGWGLAWLLGAYGEVLDIGPDAIGTRWCSYGARLAFYRRDGSRAGTVPGWAL